MSHSIKRFGLCQSMRHDIHGSTTRTLCSLLKDVDLLNQIVGMLTRQSWKCAITLIFPGLRPSPVNVAMNAFSFQR
jgi:hypothetical protein